jgi:hypothetical protein
LKEGIGLFLSVINESTKFDNLDAKRAVAACAAQLKLHVAPLWDMLPGAVVFYADPAEMPPTADILAILDDADQAGALGYHDETPEGKPYARVFVSPVLEHGGNALSGTLSVSAVLSHEVCEWFGDRFINLWADDRNGTEYAVELCDPVEQDSYEIDGVAVSNFVTKRYFDINSPAGTQMDYLNKLTRPFSMTSGGYLLLRKGGQVHEKFGERYPQWKKALKQFPAARTARLRTQES